MINYTLNEIIKNRALRYCVDAYKLNARLPILSSVLKICQDNYNYYNNNYNYNCVWIYSGPLKLLYFGSRIAVYSHEDIMLAEIKFNNIYYYFCDSDEYTEPLYINAIQIEFYDLNTNFISIALHLKKYEISLEKIDDPLQNI